jgi:hypothetical protein
MMDRPSAFLERIEELGQKINLGQPIYARTLNPTSLRDAWARYDRADFMLVLACHFSAPLDRRTAARFAIECSDRALLVFGEAERANLGRYELLVNAMHKWIDGGDLDQHSVPEGDFVELLTLCVKHSRGPLPALASVFTAWFATIGTLDVVGPYAATAPPSAWQ